MEAIRTSTRDDNNGTANETIDKITEKNWERNETSKDSYLGTRHLPQA
jgi:hypothetical protein